MATPAAGLYWPPFKRVFETLERLKLEPGSLSPESLRATLKEYELWLAAGLQGFKPPNAASRTALESESALPVPGGKKLPVEAGLRAPALELSVLLQLDEVQAYVLLRRWLVATAQVQGAGAAAALLRGGSVDGAGVAGGGRLPPEVKQRLAELYWQERLSLLQAVEGLLWLGEGECGAGPFVCGVCAATAGCRGTGASCGLGRIHCGTPLAVGHYCPPTFSGTATPSCWAPGPPPTGIDAGPCTEVIETALSSLLEQGLEESTFRSLQESLEGLVPGAGSTSGGSTAGGGGAGGSSSSAGALGALLPAFGGFGLAGSSLATAAGGGGGGTGSGAALAASPPSAVALRQRAEEAALERNSLLNILVLIYYHPRKQATPDRFLALARLFHRHLFTALLPRSSSSSAGGGGNGGGRGTPRSRESEAPSPTQHSIKLVRSEG